MKKPINLSSIFLLIVLLFTSVSFSQRVVHIDTKDGLVNGTINFFTNDSLGFMWIGSDQGLNKFSGDSFKTYNFKSNVQSIDGGTQDMLNINGEIFTINANGFLMKYDYALDVFDLLYSNPNVRFISLTKYDNQYLIIGTSNGLVVFDINTKKVFTHKNNLINRKIKVQDGLLYSATQKGLYVYYLDLKTKTFSEKEVFLSKQDIIDFDFDQEKKIWIGTEIGGLYVVSSKGISSVNLGSNFNKTYAVRKINFDKNQNALVAVDRLGLFLINQEFQITKIFSHNVDEPNTISQNSIYAIHVDEHNNYWLGIREGGVNIIQERDNVFENITHINNVSNSLANNNVRSIFEADSGEIFFGTENGLSILHNGQWKNYNKNSNLFNTAVLAITQYKDKLLLGTYGEGLLVFASKSKETQPLKLDYLSSKSFIFDLHAIGDDLWVSNSGNGNGNTFFHYSNFEFVHSYSVGLVRATIKGPDGLIYCISDTGFYEINPNTKQVKKRFNDIFNPSNLGYDLFYDSANNCIWLGSKNGLFKFSLENTSVEPIRHIDNKLGIVYSIYKDESQDLFLGCSSGLWRFSIENQNFRKFDVNDGLSIMEFGVGASEQLKDGSLMFGGPQGAVRFNPKENFQDQPISNVMIANFKINGKEVDRSILEKDINYVENITLTHDNNSFSFNFDAVKLHGSKRSLFQWQLIGLDTIPHTSYGTKTISYDNLKPGKYHLRYTAFNADNDRQTSQSKVIIIKQPFWISFWAILLYSIVSLLLIYLIIFLYKAKERKKFDENRIKFFVEVAHDIRTPVSLIQLLVKQLSNQENVEKSIELIHRNTQNLNEYVTQLLDFQKIDRNQLKISVSKVDLKDCLQKVIDDFQPILKEKSIDVEFSVSHIPVWFDLPKMSRIFYNLISNAVKYTQDGGEIKIGAHLTSQKLSISFTDNGVGIPEKQQELIFNRFTRGTNVSNKGIPGTGIGLMLSKKIVELHGGQILLESKVNVGSKFTIELPSGSEHYDEDQIVYTPQTKTTHQLKHLLHDNIRVLLVEDNDELRHAIKTELKKEVSVIEANNGKEGLILALSKSPDIIITDVMMPIMDGKELCHLLKTNFKTSHIPVIMLTALANVDDKIKGLETGADAYVEKPFNVSILLATIKNLLQSRANITPLLKGESVTSTMTPDESFLSDIVDIIKKNMTNEDFSIDQLGQTMGLSRSSLFRKIKGLVQISPSDLIIKIKLNRAEELMKSKTFSRVSDIAYESGFKDPKYFSTLFKKHYDKTPKEFMQEE